MLALFIVLERPLLELSLFARWRFVGVQLVAASPAFAYVVLIVLMPGRFIGIEGQSALQAGWAMLALSAPFLAALLARHSSAGVTLLVAALVYLLLGRERAAALAAEA